MSRPPKVGDRLGPYELNALIGAGGMGEVYRARDTRLGRDVAVKILPPDVAGDADRLRRFEQEARATAALSHPNILALFDVGNEQGVAYLVAELLDGHSLRETLATAMPLERAVEIAAAVADGLAAAHSRGVVHRDLKPENVFITADGHVKLLDFGIAKVRAPEAAGDHDATVTAQQAATAFGVVLGTPGYMAPEQVRGETVDARADIFALGCVLYEMLAGRRAFAGQTPIETFAHILRDTPAPLTTGPGDRAVPAPLRQIVDRCLMKRPPDRFQSASDLAFALRAAAALPAPGPARPARAGFARLPWVVAAVVGVAAIVAVSWALRPRTPLEPEQRREFLLGVPDDVRSPRSLMISPHGTRVALVARAPDSDQEIVWTRPLDSIKFTPLPATAGVGRFFWSADDKSLGFFAGTQLRRVEIASGVVQVICAITGGRGGTWNADGTIVFAPGLQTPLFRVSAAPGSTPVALTTMSNGESSHRMPTFLPDGRRFVFLATHNSQSYDVKLGSLDSPSSSVLIGGLPVPTQAEWANGELLFRRDDAGPLLAQPFDDAAGTLRGEARPVVGATATENLGWHRFSVSTNGLLVYQAAEPPAVFNLVWHSDTGRELDTLSQSVEFPDWALSPDGKRLAFTQRPADAALDQAARQVWVHDLEHKVASQVTHVGPGWVARVPVWSADSRRIVYARGRTLLFVPDLYTVEIDNPASDTVIYDADRAGVVPASWSPDGRVILSRIHRLQDNGNELDAVSLDGPTVTVTPFAGDATATFSSDGRLVAYAEFAAGRTDVYVKRYPDGARVAVAGDAGVASCQWRQDGGELYVRFADGRIVAYPVRADTAVTIGAARPLFTLPADAGAGWQPSSDGRRFLIQLRRPGPRPAPEPYRVVTGWSGGGGR